MNSDMIPGRPMNLDAGDPGRADIFTRLLKNRVVMLGTDVNDDIANQLCAQLLYLEGEDPDADIWLYINSPGGSVTAGMAIFDTIQFLKPPVSTMCIGQACSMGAVLLAAGAAGKRYCLPNSRVMIHQPLGGFSGQAADAEIHVRELLMWRQRLNDILSRHTGKPFEQVARDTDRDNFLSAAEARAYGLIDAVIDKRGAGATKVAGA